MEVKFYGAGDLEFIIGGTLKKYSACIGEGLSFGKVGHFSS